MNIEAKNPSRQELTARYQLQFEPKDRWLHIKVTGVNSRETVTAYLKELVSECGVRGCDRILVEERLEGPRLPFADVFALAASGSAEVLGAFSALAYVDVFAVDDLMKFAEDVVVNRGVPARVFATVSEAETWLRAQTVGARVGLPK